MKFTANRDTLLAACQLAATGCAVRDIRPTLKNLKASATSNTLLLSATDLETAIRVATDITLEDPGEALLPADRIVAILREAGVDTVGIEADKDSTKVSAFTSLWEMPGDDAALFPDMPYFPEGDCWTLVAAPLREQIRRTLFATADASAKFGATTGVLWDLENGKAILVATDGRRLAAAEAFATPRGQPAPTNQSVVPQRAMEMLNKALAGAADEATVSVVFRPNEALFQVGGATLYTRLVEGRFPEWSRAMPTAPKATVTLPVGPLTATVRQAAIFTEKDSQRILFAFGKDRLRLRSEGGGKATSSMAIEGYAGPETEIAFAGAYVLQMLKAMPADGRVVVEMTGGTKPALFRTEDGSYRHVITPLVITEVK